MRRQQAGRLDASLLRQNAGAQTRELFDGSLTPQTSVVVAEVEEEKPPVRVAHRRTTDDLDELALGSVGSCIVDIPESVDL